jgi:hypothetical protein
MVVSAIQNPTAQLAQNSLHTTQPGHGADLEGLIESTASVQDVAAFHSTVQQSVLQNSATFSASNSTDTAGSAGNIVMNMVDNIEDNHKKALGMMANFNELSPHQAVELQETAEKYYITTQFLSKVVSTAAKQIDSLVHTQ